MDRRYSNGLALGTPACSSRGMPSRRDFLKLAATASFAGSAARGAAPSLRFEDQRPATGAEDRDYWRDIARRLATPMLEALAHRRLKAEMPVEAKPNRPRAHVTHLEALGRLLCGLAPWLDLADDGTPEGGERARFAALARTGIDAATDPQSPDFMNFTRDRQPLVDAAFLAQSFLRAPRALWHELEPRVQRNVVAALVSTRAIPPVDNNWRLFATTIEAFLHHTGEKRDDARLFEGIRKHRDWYVGDGVYGDGAEFHWDYYNSFVIQPMLLEALDVMADEASEWETLRAKARDRLTRWAAIQERSVAPDGSFPAIGRSLAYRCGAFQGLALAALRGLLPKEISPAQARVALTAVIRRTLEAPGTWDDKGWLRIGLAGHQPALGENYISTGSLYLCSAALLPLGLPPTDSFWNSPPEKTTWEKVWAGGNVPADRALRSPK